jgi:hypothetical protein
MRVFLSAISKEIAERKTRSANHEVHSHNGLDSFFRFLVNEETAKTEAFATG